MMPVHLTESEFCAYLEKRRKEEQTRKVEKLVKAFNGRIEVDDFGHLIMKSNDWGTLVIDKHGPQFWQHTDGNIQDLR